VSSSTLVLARYPVAWRPIAYVFLPFAAGYYLTYLFRTINALIAGHLTTDLGLGAADLGLLTSVFFLSLAAVQIPLGILLDRYGPKRVQITLLPIAAFGALLFGSANSFSTLMIARALIGIGVAGSLMSGLKAIVLWFPRDRIPMANGCFIMLGALGAVTAAAPAEALSVAVGWRGLFELLAIASTACALFIYLLVPDARLHRSSAKVSNPTCLKSIYCDARFWRLAPLSATCIGSAWALHGLWAAPWLKDVEGLDQRAVVQRLFVMAVAACAGALVLGLGADRWRTRRRSSSVLLTIVATLFIAAEFALALRWPIPSGILWGIVAAVGAATVLSFAMLAEHFPKEIAGQANAALNLLHVGGAFLLQSGIGFVIGRWTAVYGHYPSAAYQTAFAIIIALQFAALLWFVRPDGEVRAPSSQLEYATAVFTRPVPRHPTLDGYKLAAQTWADRLVSARAEVAHWRLVALGTGALCIPLFGALVTSAVQTGVAPHMIVVGRVGMIRAAEAADVRPRPADAQIAFLLAQFVEDISSLSTDPVVVRTKWARAYAMTTPRGADALNRFATDSLRSTKIGTQAIIAHVTSVVRASDEAFEVHWRELTYQNGAPIRIEHLTGLVTIMFKEPGVMTILIDNPLGAYIDKFDFSRW
jgi:type IV secretory pathway TrbF-like protein/sugar phosphate permease